MIGTEGYLGMRKMLMVTCLLAIPALAVAQSLGGRNMRFPKPGPMLIYQRRFSAKTPGSLRADMVGVF
jgi:hypothetical protein